MPHQLWALSLSLSLCLMVPAAVTNAISVAINALMTEMETQHKVLKDALDKEFDSVRKQNTTMTDAVKATFAIADAQVREDPTQANIKH